MWEKFKRAFGFGGRDDASTSSQEQGEEYDFRWHEPGGENPFGVRILDVRPLTETVISTTADEQIAESFNMLRHADGRDLIAAEIENSTTVDCDLRFPHNGEPLEGVIFKADSMDVKWDIYIYDSVLLFARSWTGNLVYRAVAEIGSAEIRISRIETNLAEAEGAPQAVYFLLASHAMQLSLPHTVECTPEADAKTIALMSFSMYGRYARFATPEDITKIEIPMPE